MTESKKEENKVSPKANKSLIDEDFGKDFLSSWKSSATEDDAMDFSFDNSEKGKQKKFNFDKLDMDMDFNLSDDFGKVSSFKFDMPDLDFSSAPKKTEKAKEGNAEESPGGKGKGLSDDFGKVSSFNFDMPDLDFSSVPKKTAKAKEGNAEESPGGKGKGERFSFSFDFNEMDSFDFGSSLTKGEIAPKKDLTGEKVASENVGDQSSKLDQSEDEDKVVRASKSTALPYIDNSVTSDGDLASTKKNSVGEPTNFEIALEKTEKTPCVTKSASAEENHQQVHLSEENLSSIPHAEHREGGNSESDSHLHPGSFSAGVTGYGTPQIEKHICDTMTEEETSFHGNLQLPDPPSLEVGMYISKTVSTDKMLDVAASEYPIDSIKCMLGESNLGAEPTHSITGEKQFNGTMNEDGQNSGEKVALALLSREPICEVTPDNGKESGVVHSKVFKGLDDNRSRPQLLPSFVMKPMQIEAKRVVAVNRSPTEEIRERSTTKDIEHGGMAISNLYTTSGDPTGGAELESQIARESSKSGGELRDKKLVESQKIIEDTSKTGFPFPESSPNTIAISRGQTRVPQLVERNQIINDASKIRDQRKGEQLVQSLKVNQDASIDGDQTRVPKLIERQKFNEHASKTGDQPRISRLVQSQIIQNSSKIGDQAGVPTLASQKIIDRTSKVGLQLNSSNLVKKFNASADQAGENPQPMSLSTETLGNSTISSLGANKLNPIKASKITSNLPALSSSRIPARKEEQLGPRHLAGSSTTSSSQKSAELRTNSLEKILSHSHGNDVDKQTLLTSKNSMHKQVLLTPPLKRKTHESEDTNLISPFKRLSPSPGENRRLEDSSKKVAFEERRKLLAYSPPNQVDIKPKNVSNSNLASSQINISNEMKKMAQLEISSVTENDGTVEKAEAYTKELEDMCNMLKKKQEEAKDLLLRAIVSNNNLLMLNHPMFEHKMRKVQKLASQLTGEGVGMCID